MLIRQQRRTRVALLQDSGVPDNADGAAHNVGDVGMVGHRLKMMRIRYIGY